MLIGKQLETLAVISFGSELLLVKSKVKKEWCQVCYNEPYFGWCQNSGERLMRSVFAHNSALIKNIFSGPKVFLKGNLDYCYELLKLEVFWNHCFRDANMNPWI